MSHMLKLGQIEATLCLLRIIVIMTGKYEFHNLAAIVVVMWEMKGRDECVCLSLYNFAVAYMDQRRCEFFGKMHNVVIPVLEEQIGDIIAGL